MILHLNGELSAEMLEKLFSGISSLKNDEKLIIYFNCDGGLLSFQEAIVDCINKNADNITVIAFDGLYSAAFNIFFRLKCKREILSTAIGMAHIYRHEPATNGLNKHMTDYDKFYSSWLKDFTIENMEFLKELGLSAAHLKKIKKGEDVYFNYKSLKEFLENTIKN